jgi:hypothetical protein
MHFLIETQIAYVMMNESILLEDRIQYLKDNIGKITTDHDPDAEHKSTPEIVDHFANNADPTKNKAHTQYLLNLYKSGKIQQKDAEKIKSTLSDFEKYKGKLSPEDKQLTKKVYPDIESISKKIEPHLGTMTSKKQAEKTLDQPGHKKVFEDDNIAVYHLTDKDASQHLYGGGSERGGTGTNWCTAARSNQNQFDHYHGEGNIHVVHRKKDGKVFQMHPASGQFMNSKNEQIEPEEFESIKSSVHKAMDAVPKILD